ncbi:hypothetical protein Bca4012_074206 [Brassica carinata]
MSEASTYSRGRLVAGSFQGKTGHADGKHSEARFNHPKRSHSGMFMSLILRGINNECE